MLAVAVAVLVVVLLVREELVAAAMVLLDRLAQLEAAEPQTLAGVS